VYFWTAPAVTLDVSGHPNIKLKVYKSAIQQQMNVVILQFRDDDGSNQAGRTMSADITSVAAGLLIPHKAYSQLLE
jgi:hypothetical protein